MTNGFFRREAGHAKRKYFRVRVGIMKELVESVRLGSELRAKGSTFLWIYSYRDSKTPELPKKLFILKYHKDVSGNSILSKDSEINSDLRTMRQQQERTRQEESISRFRFLQNLTILRLHFCVSIFFRS